MITAQQSYALVSICVYGMRSTGIVYLILYENILADGDMHCNGTGGTYLDMGTNVGYQVNKLYRPECTSPVQNIFDEFFKKRRSVCTIGIEPNPLLQTKLSNLRKRYLEQGINVTILFGFASTTRGFSLFYFNAKYMNGSSHNYSTGGEYKHGHDNGQTVRNVDVSRLIWQIRSKPIVAKMDVEGSEIKLLPHLLQTGALCLISLLYVELHDAEAKQVYQNTVQGLKMRNCKTRLVILDDESRCDRPETTHKQLNSYNSKTNSNNSKRVATTNIRGKSGKTVAGKTSAVENWHLAKKALGRSDMTARSHAKLATRRRGQ